MKKRKETNEKPEKPEENLCKNSENLSKRTLKRNSLAYWAGPKPRR